MNTTSATSLISRTGIESYDAARWADWVPHATRHYSAGGLQCVLQHTPGNAFGTNETDVSPSNKNVLLFFTKGTPSLDGRIAGQSWRRPMQPWDIVFIPADADSWWASTPRSADGVFHMHIDRDLERDDIRPERILSF